MRILYVQNLLDIYDLGWMPTEDYLEYALIAFGMEIDWELVLDMKMKDLQPYRNEIIRQFKDYNESNEGDGWSEIKIKYPPKDIKSDTVRMLEPTARKIVSISMSTALKSPVLYNIHRINRCTEVPVDILKQLRIGDFQILLEMLEDFLGESKLESTQVTAY